MRHGQSEANVAQIIASSPVIATQKYGLSDVGKEQAALAGQDVVQAFHKAAAASPQRTSSILLLTSDLLRAKETAEIVQQYVQQAGIPLYYEHDNDSIDDDPSPSLIITNKHDIENGLAIETRLRERWFGEWDGTSDKNYPETWKHDVLDPDHTIRGVESVHQVVDRTTECIVEWDNRVQNCFVICVAHGDVLQIMQTAFAKMDAAKHRSLDHLETATLRQIKLVE